MWSGGYSLPCRPWSLSEEETQLTSEWRDSASQSCDGEEGVQTGDCPVAGAGWVAGAKEVSGLEAVGRGGAFYS